MRGASRGRSRDRAPPRTALPASGPEEPACPRTTSEPGGPRPSLRARCPRRRSPRRSACWKKSCSLGCSPGVDPRPAYLVGLLKCPDGVVAAQGEQDLVEPLDEAHLPPRIDIEAVDLAGRRSDRLRFEINRDAARPLTCLDLGCEAIDQGLVENDRQNAVLKTVGKEDVAEAGTDDGPNAHFVNGPHGALAG